MVNVRSGLESATGAGYCWYGTARNAALITSLLLLLGLLSACAKPVTLEPLEARPSSLFLEDPGTIVVFDDEDCFIREEAEGFIPGSFELPAYADRATVFLNGWRLLYLNGDHHIRRIEVELREIGITGSTLNWEARGLLADDDFNDDYSFCYTYTVIGWNSRSIDAAAANGDPPANSVGADAHAIMPTFRAIPAALRGKETLAVLPEGFFLQVPDGEGDRHLLQAGSNIDHSALYLEQGRTYGALGQPMIAADASRFDRNFASWNYTALFSDNDLDDETTHIGRFGLLAGDDLTLIQPPFTLKATEDSGTFGGGCFGSPFPPGLQSKEVEVVNLPFDYAVPILSGWSLEYPCDDEHVLDIGVWLDDIAYEKDPNEETGVLRYRVTQQSII